jgi:hypothetical protein
MPHFLSLWLENHCVLKKAQRLLWDLQLVGLDFSASEASHDHNIQAVLNVDRRRLDESRGGLDLQGIVAAGGSAAAVAKPNQRRSRGRRRGTVHRRGISDRFRTLGGKGQ